MSELSGNIATIDPSTQDHLSDSDVGDNNNSDDENSAAEPSPAGLFGESEGREDAENSNNGSEPTTDASVPTITRGENKYQQKFRLSWEQIAQLEGVEVKAGRNLDEITWKVVSSVTADEIGADGYCGMKDFSFYKKPLAEAFMDLWPGDFATQYEYMVKEVRDVINPQRKKEMKRVIKEPSKSELTKFLACLIAAAQYAERGVNLFSGFRGAAKKMKGRLRSKPDFSYVMSHTRWTEIKALVPLMMEGEKGDDPWWKVRGFVDGFNKTRQEKLSISKIIALDESMSGFWPRYVKQISYNDHLLLLHV